MEDVTLGNIYDILIFIIGLIGAIITICTYIKKTFSKALATELEPIKQELNDEAIQRLRANLVNYQCLIDKDAITDIQRQNYYEQLDLYTNKYKCNSYIHQEHERLVKAGKL